MIRVGDGGQSGTIPSDVLARTLYVPTAGVDPGVQTGLPSQTEVSQTLQLFPWWLYEPVDGVDILKDGQFTFSAAGTQTIAALTTQLPANSIGIVRSIDLYINSMVTTTNVTWSLQVNNAPVDGYGAMTIFPRLATSVSRSFDTMIFLPQGATITVVVTNTDGGLYQVGASYQGWHVNANVPGRKGLSPVG